MHAIAMTFLAALLVLPGAAALAADWSAYKSALVDRSVARYLARQGPIRMRTPVHAMSLAIGIDGEMVLARGYGEARPGTPAGARTVYHIGSLSKQFTAAAVLRLIETGAKAPLTGTPITIRTPMRDVFPGVSLWESPDRPAITVRRLLTMTSALPSLMEHPPTGTDPWGEIAADRMLDALRLLPATGAAARFSYNNSSYFLLAQLVEAATSGQSGARESFRALLRASVLDRAGLKDTGFIGDYAPGTDLVVASPSWGPQTPKYRLRPAYVEREWLKGSADMATSVADLFLWNKALMENAVLRSESRDLMFADWARVSLSRYYGMGWFIDHADGWDWFTHTGQVPGYTGLNAIVRKSDGAHWISVSLLTNADGVEDLEALVSDIVRVTLQ